MEHNNLFLLSEDTWLFGFHLNCNTMLLFLHLSGKKLPKNEGAGPQQNIRPTQNEQSRQNSGCCSKWCYSTGEFASTFSNDVYSSLDQVISITVTILLIVTNNEQGLRKIVIMMVGSKTDSKLVMLYQEQQ